MLHGRNTSAFINVTLSKVFIMDFTLPLWLLHSIILVALGIATYTDIRTREVPDLLNYSLIGLGILAGILTTVFTWTIWPLLWSITGLVAGYLVGALMFYTGQWGGGDAKMLMGIGALQGFSIIGIINGELPLFLSTIATIFVAGAVYGLLYILYLSIKKWKPFKAAFIKKIHEPQFLKIRKIVLGIVLVCIIAFIVFDDVVIKTMAGTLGLLIFFGQYGYIVSKVLEKITMIKDVPLNKVTEGDWIAKDVVIKGKRICGPKDLGISNDQIEQLKKLKVKKITIKEGIPFIPGFLLGYILLIILGNWMMILL